MQIDGKDAGERRVGRFNLIDRLFGSYKGSRGRVKSKKETRKARTWAAKKKAMRKIVKAARRRNRGR